MNSVAVSNVTAILSHDFSASAVSKNNSSKDFSAILEKSKASQGLHEGQMKALKSVKSKGKEDLISPKEEINEKPINEKEINKKPINENEVNEKEIEQKEDLSVTEVTQTVTTKTTEPNHAEEIEAEVINKIATSLGMKDEELIEMMASLNLTFMDLFSNKGLQTLMNKVFGMDGEMDLLKNPNAFDIFKEIKGTLKDVLKEFNMNLEDLKRQVEAIKQTETVTQTIAPLVTNEIPVEKQSAAGSTANEEATAKQSRNYTVEVVDDRTESSDLKEVAVVEELEQKDTQSENKKQKNGSNFQEQLEQVFQKVTQKVEVVTGSGIKEIVYATNTAKEIMSQVVSQVKISLTDVDTTMTFQLKPESLGKVAFSVTSQNGSMTGHFVAESSAVKETIEANLVSLKATLQEQGIKLDEVKVVVGNTNQFFEQSDQSKNFNQSSKNKRRRFTEEDGAIEAIGSKLVDLKETIANQYLDQQEHSVEFSA